MEKSKALQQFERAIHPVDRILQKFFSPAAPYIVEFTGTFFLILVITVIGGQETNILLAPLAIGFTLMVAIFAGGHVSGAHYNPAVTLTVLLSGRSKITPRSAALYIIMQLLASLIAPLCSWAITGNSAGPAIGNGYSVWQALFAELLWTFFLCTTVLNVATTKSQEGNSFFGHAIGFCVAAGAISLGGISGAVFNPAVGFGPVIIHAGNLYFSQSLSFWDNFNFIWVYWVAPILAGIVAPMVFRVTAHKEYVGASGVAGMMDEESDLFSKEKRIINEYEDS